MSNTFFEFKKFTVHQDQCAMKVCTDACILGAWFAEKVPDYSLILDIGSGTGLLMLMLAQKCNGEIHGIEKDLGAFKQLKQNIQQTRWKERLKAFPGDARTFSFPDKYNFIIANPPFFENDLASTDEADQAARHSKYLSLKELARIVSENLDSDGGFGILLPYQRWNHFHQLAVESGLHLREKLLIRQSKAKSDFFRVILHYTRNRENFIAESELVIQRNDGLYTEEFRELLRDYYLNL